MKKVVLLDGYIDEPSCLGVSPYISPQVRYVYGALLLAGLKEEQIHYLTADQAREFLPGGDWLIVIGGTTVPGRYLGGKPLTLKEMEIMALENTSEDKWLLGPVVEAGLRPPGYDNYIGEEIIQGIMGRLGEPREFSIELLKEVALRGAGLIIRHPRFPYVVAELETYRGCLRSSHCSFCSERFRRFRYVRPAEDVIREAVELGKRGARYFRLGCQPDLLSYADGRKNTLRRLYSGIREGVPGLKVLHLDNVEPGALAGRKDAAELLGIITRFNTPGDIASFGLESADPEVIRANNIGVTPEQCKKAVELVNKIGGERENGLPKLLPGLNFLHGLQGESEKTRELNLGFLRELVEEGFLLRRINIRQVIAHAGYKKKAVTKGAFERYKETINREINRPMLEKVFPRGLVFQEVIPEKVEGNLTFGRFLGTYPVRIGIPGQKELYQPLRVKIIDHGFRSLTGIQYPFNINQAEREELLALPGVGKKRAAEIILQRPFTDLGDMRKRLEKELVEKIEVIIDCF